MTEADFNSNEPKDGDEDEALNEPGPEDDAEVAEMLKWAVEAGSWEDLCERRQDPSDHAFWDGALNDDRD